MRFIDEKIKIGVQCHKELPTRILNAACSFCSAESGVLLKVFRGNFSAMPPAAGSTFTPSAWSAEKLPPGATLTLRRPR